MKPKQADEAQASWISLMIYTNYKKYNYKCIALGKENTLGVILIHNLSHVPAKYVISIDDLQLTVNTSKRLNLSN